MQNMPRHCAPSCCIRWYIQAMAGLAPMHNFGHVVHNCPCREAPPFTPAVYRIKGLGAKINLIKLKWILGPNEGARGCTTFGVVPNLPHVWGCGMKDIMGFMYILFV
uniref:Uncharacterized protein n=1 Tax=Eutreptiella gymnastica TaxID=73025 RepID=A0A7S4CUQ9_9EUGL